MKTAIIILGTIISFILLIAPACSKEIKSEVFLDPSGNIKQGETVFVELKSDSKLKNPFFIYNNNKIKLYKKEKGLYTGIMGINALDNPGEYKLSFYNKNKPLNLEKTLNVVSSNFPIDNIIITGEKSQLTIDRIEQQKIQYCLTKTCKKALWQNLPLNTPAEGFITSLFGGIRYKNGQPTGNYHKGLDIGAPEGQDVNAAADGVVLLAEQFTYFGNTIIIDHGQGIASVYMHLSEIDVKPKETVKLGQTIAKVGSTGYATGPHLHFSIYINGTPVNPLGTWIKPMPLNIN